MKTIEEMVEVMNSYADGNEVEYLNYQFWDDGWELANPPIWDWDECDYRIKQHSYKVGDWVEVVKSHDESRIGNIVQITEIDSDGDLWAGGCIVLDARYGEEAMCQIKPAKKPEPQYEPFTAETFPKGVVWLKWKDPMFKPGHSLVLCVYDERIKTINNTFKYSYILNECLISTDNCETWQKAGVEK